MGRDTYAFGDTTIDGTPCPALAAGREIPQNDAALTVAEEYDTVVRERYDIDEGTLPASIAESCWIQAIHNTRLNADYYAREDPEHAEYLDEAVAEGEAIESELF